MTLPDVHLSDPGTQRVVDHINAFGVPLKMLDHNPTDADFTNPRDGYGAINYTTSKLFFRILGAWKGVTLI
jgi:hypothetical protein